MHGDTFSLCSVALYRISNIGTGTGGGGGGGGLEVILSGVQIGEHILYVHTYICLPNPSARQVYIALWISPGKFNKAVV